MSAEKTLRAMPKVELHCHLDGSLRVKTILELARNQRVKLPADTVQGLKPHVTVPSSCRSLAEFLKVFDLVDPLLRDPAPVERAAYELIEDCAADNIRHVEVRDAPMLHVHAKFSPVEYISAVLRGLERGLKDFKVTSGFIICLLRSHSPRENRTAFEALKKCFKPNNGLAKPGVVGMDLAGDEARYPTMMFAQFYEEANRLAIPTTCHAGETAGTENLKAALSLDVRRIGHGTNLFTDEKLLNEVVRRKVPLEIGLTSNVRTQSVPALSSHPLRRFYEAGVPVSLNTDDRGIIGITLTHEYLTALELGFTPEELSRMTLGSIDHLFLPEADRRRLKASFAAELAVS